MLKTECLGPEGLLYIRSRRFADNRGFFAECFREDEFRALSGGGRCVQLNRSFSLRNVIRGLHFQNPHPQGKLVFVLQGEIYDVAVDLRRGSPTFAQSFGRVLRADADEALYVPEGFGHGFSVLSDSAMIMYACTDVYRPEAERCIRFDDPTLRIDWKIGRGEEIVSEKDRAGLLLDDAKLFE